MSFRLHLKIIKGVRLNHLNKWYNSVFGQKKYQKVMPVLTVNRHERAKINVWTSVFVTISIQDSSKTLP